MILVRKWSIWELLIFLLNIGNIYLLICSSSNSLANSVKKNLYGNGISTVPPKEYAKRLVSFVQKNLLNL